MSMSKRAIQQVLLAKHTIIPDSFFYIEIPSPPQSAYYQLYSWTVHTVPCNPFHLLTATSHRLFDWMPENGSKTVTNLIALRHRRARLNSDLDRFGDAAVTHRTDWLVVTVNPSEPGGLRLVGSNASRSQPNSELPIVHKSKATKSITQNKRITFGFGVNIGPRQGGRKRFVQTLPGECVWMFVSERMIQFPNWNRSDKSVGTSVTSPHQCFWTMKPGKIDGLIDRETVWVIDSQCP